VNMLAVVTGHVALQQPAIMLNILPVLKREYPGPPYVESRFPRLLRGNWFSQLDVRPLLNAPRYLPYLRKIEVRKCG